MIFLYKGRLVEFNLILVPFLGNTTGPKLSSFQLYFISFGKKEVL